MSELSSTILDYFQRGVEAEMGRSRAIDGKTANLMGFTSVLSGLMIPFTAIAEGALADAAESWQTGRIIVQALFVAAVLLLFGAIFCFFRSSRVRGYHQPPRFEPSDLQAWQNFSQDQLNLRFAQTYQRIWQHNKHHNDQKALWTQRGFFVLMLGGGVVVTSVCWIVIGFTAATA